MTLIKTIAVAPGEKPIHIEMTPEEEAAFLAQQSDDLARNNEKDKKAAAKQALVKSDVQVLRCYEDKIDVPEEWVSYRQKLRDFIENGGDLPLEPKHP